MPTNSGTGVPPVCHRHRRDAGATRATRGVVLIITLVVVAMLALGAYTFSDLMLTEQESVDLYGDHLQAKALSESGIESARLLLMQDLQTRNQLGGTYNNPTRFRGQLVVDDPDPRRRGRFTLIAPLVKDGELGGMRFGLENESTRLNLNALLLADAQQQNGGRTLLMGLPGMTSSVADAILDWIDDDDNIREFGCEREYYSGLDPPYAPRNGPLETVEELLLIRGVAPQLLFGRDMNRNGMVDAHEQALPTPVSSTVVGGMDRGWSAYLTLYSQEANRNPSGQPRIWLNQQDMQQLHSQLSAVFPNEWANFIVAYRQNGPFKGSQDDDRVKADSGELDLSKPGQFQLTQVLDLIGPNVKIGFQGDEDDSVLQTPFPDDLIAMAIFMPLLMDNVTVNQSPTIPGRININQASRVVLAGIPGMDQEIINQIVSIRDPEPDLEKPNRRHETWLVTEAVVSLSQMRGLVPFITGGGDVYRTQAVGYFDGGHASARGEVIIDATSPLPRVVSWRDISHLGRGYALETLGVAVEEE